MVLEVPHLTMVTLWLPRGAAAKYNFKFTARYTAPVPLHIELPGCRLNGNA